MALAATSEVASPLSRANKASSPLDFVATGVALMSVLVGLFVACYAVSFVWPLSGLAHGWVGLFATEPQNVGRTLLEGIAGSIGAAWVAAVLFVPVYNTMLSR